MPSNSPNLILPSDKFSENEADEAKKYWSSIDFKSYVEEQPWSKFMAKQVSLYKPSTVFEFGCNAGKNLIAIKKEIPSVKCYGVDINKNAISYALLNNLSVSIGDENTLRIIPDKSFDVLFCVSVLDHIPNPGPVLAEFGRISRFAILLLEPFLGKQGKVIKNYNTQANKIIDTTPYSYSWDLLLIGRENISDWDVSHSPFPLDTNLGRYYNFYSFTPRSFPIGESYARTEAE